MKKGLLVLLFAPLFSVAQYKVSLNDIKTNIQPTMWGLFFEDINRSGDGGLYAELIKNRSFDFPDAFMGWNTIPSRGSYAKNEIFQVINQSGVSPNDPKYMQVTRSNNENVILSNDGFGGVTVTKNGKYELTVVCREKVKGLHIKAEIVNSKNIAVATTSLDNAIVVSRAAADDDKGNNFPDIWKALKVLLTTTDSTVNGRLVLKFDGQGQIDLDRVSLIPATATKNLRSDLVEKLATIKPGFMRFPGGCIVEGDNTETRYQWKNTIGTLEQRKLNSNQWSDGGASGKPMKDYMQSYGLGFYEYFQLCEDIGAAPMPIINAGLSCQFGAGEVIPANEMDSYVQDALDLIEFANGDAGTVWGKKRISLGHASPFNMTLLGVGNENWGPQYVERLDMFTKAIKAKYPTIQLICATGYTPNPQFKYMDSVLRAKHVDIIDEHYYQTANWFFMNANKYDSYDRKGPKIFIGEYACHSVRIGNPENKNTQLCALAEAAWMTGLERNADVVTMAAYAPLFAHVKDWQWTPNLIWFDNQKSYATPSYYVQQLFSVNKGTDVVPIFIPSAKADGKSSGAQKSTPSQNFTAGEGLAISGQDSVWASAVIDKNSNEVIIKLVNPSSVSKQKTIDIPELKKKVATGTLTVLKGSPDEVNSIEKESVLPVTSAVAIKNKKAIIDLAPYSFTVLRIKI